jgi:hypothetical protein
MGVLLLCRAETALAGMPSLTLSDVARMRVQTISFFLGVILLSAWIVRLLWNLLRKDVTRLPALSYKGALGGTLLWGLLFLFVLSMISGARELMTPGAWEKKGATYQLVDDSKAIKMQERRTRLEKLRDALDKYAMEHDGQYPLERSNPAIPAELWNVPDPSGMQYLYIPAERGKGPIPLAFEPELFGSERLVLCANGAIVTMTSDDIARVFAAEKK